MSQIFAKKSLGQNFLKDESVLKQISSSFDTCSQDVIIEIGPGKGALTKYLIQKPSRLVCYEIDERMKEFLSPFLSDRCHVIFDDFLKRDITKDIGTISGNIFVIANIPYYITTPIITSFFDQDLMVSGMTLLVQREVADRFCATPKHSFYGYFTVVLNHFFDIQRLCDVSPRSFSPAPKVWSSVVRFVRKEHIIELDFSLFQEFLKQAFSQKRKTLKNNLKSYDVSKINSILGRNHLSTSARPEELSYEIFVELFQALV